LTKAWPSRLMIGYKELANLFHYRLVDSRLIEVINRLIVD